MWFRISRFIIKNRVLLIVSMVLATAFMAYKASDVEMAYDFVQVVPKDDPDLQYFNAFKEQYGEDGNIFVIGFKDDGLYKVDKFRKYYQLCKALGEIEGVKDVISMPTLKTLAKSEDNSHFEMRPVFNSLPTTQQEVDDMVAQARNVKLFDGQLFNAEGATLIAISIERSYLNSPRRMEVVDNIMGLTEQFSAETSIKAHYAGLPYVRSIMMKEVKDEFKLFLILAAVVTSLILFFFFRSGYAVLLTFLIIAITVVWTLGTLVIFGYKVTLLTGILPAVIIVIGIPNCIYMFNKYHQEFRKHKNKVKAVSRAVQKVGALTMMTNATTAIGFLVLFFTDIIILKEFGLVAGIITMSVFFISIMVIPSMLIFLPSPNAKQLKHLDLKVLNKLNHTLEQASLRYRPYVYVITAALLITAFYGATKVKTLSYMVDDLPSKSDVKSDLAFLEDNFGGVMPLEIVVDMKTPKAIFDLNNLEKLDRFDAFLRSLDHVSAPLSVVNVVKASNQAFYNGNPAMYKVPNKNDRMFLMKYLKGNTEDQHLMSSMSNKEGSTARFTAKVADLGTYEMNRIVNEQILPKANEIFGDKAEVKVTGTTLLFLKGNGFLIKNLASSLLFAFAIIAGIMALLFKNIKMVLISLVPNLIPLILTVGIMGIFGIPLKPSTALIFSIAFGIAVDDTIHFLSKYNQELKFYQGNVLKAVTKSLSEVGVSMIYTSIVLFFGFVIFAFSDFGGTVALGLLTSMTLFFAMVTNLTILPSLLITSSKGYRNNFFPLLSKRSAHQTEEDDEEIDLSKLRLQTKSELHSEEV